MKIKILILFVFIFYKQSPIAFIHRYCDYIIDYPEDIQSQYYVTRNYIYTQKTLNVISEYSEKFLQTNDMYFNNYGINEHIMFLLEIVENIQLPNKSLKKINKFVKKLIKQQQKTFISINFKRLILYTDTRVIDDKLLFSKILSDEIKNKKFKDENEKIRYRHDVFIIMGLFAQRGMVNEIKLLTTKLDLKEEHLYKQLMVRKAKVVNLFKNKEDKLKSIIENEIKSTLNELYFIESPKDGYFFHNKYVGLREYFFWLIKQLGLNNGRKGINNILLNLNKDIWFYNKSEYKEILEKEVSKFGYHLFVKVEQEIEGYYKDAYRRALSPYEENKLENSKYHCMMPVEPIE